MLKEIAKTEYDDGMTDNEHPLAAVLARNHLHRASQPQNHIAPALSTGRSVVELSKQPTEFRLLGMALAYADAGQTVENPELFFTQPLIDDERIAVLR